MEKAFLKILSRKLEQQSKMDKSLIAKKVIEGEYNIIIDQARYPLGNLKDIFARYDLQPGYQRSTIWDRKRKSRLIESLLVNVPIPPIYLYEVEFNEYEVMDGLQRISTIIEYLSNDFVLQDLELWSDLNGYSYNELPEELKRSINRRYLSAIIILKESNKSKEKEEEIKQFIFERLNTGGMELSPQEIRNALYRGKFNEMINEVVSYSKFVEMIGNQKKKMTRMEDRELVLRFFAYKSSFENNVRLGTKEALDLYAKKARRLTHMEVGQAEEYFLTVIEAIYIYYGEKAFCKTNKSKFERMIYDTLVLSFSKLIDEYGEDFVFTPRHTLDINRKYNFIVTNKDVFNGKYTALTNVESRVNLFYDFLKMELGIE